MAIEATAVELAALLRLMVNESAPQWLASETGGDRIGVIAAEISRKAREEREELANRVDEAMKNF